MKINNLTNEIGKRIEDVNINDIIVTNTTHLIDNLKSPDDIGKAIFNAASKGRTDELKQLCELNKGNAVLNWKNEDDHTPLSAACGYGMHESVSILLLSGCDKNSVDKFGNSPAYVASWNCQSKCLKVLIKHGCDIKKCNYYGKSPIYIACSVGSEKCVSLLLKAGADTTKTDKDGRSPMSVAKNDKIKLMLKEAKNKNGEKSKDNDKNQDKNSCCSVS